MYIKKLGIEIRESRNNHPVHRNSIFLAEHVVKEKFKNILEIGTGTGIIALYLAKNGSKVTAIDINKDSIKIARENASLNNINVRWIVSDLYKNVDGKYDCIIFLPPYFTFDSFSKIAFMFEKLFPTPLMVWISYFLDRFFLGGRLSIPRRRLIRKFLEESRSYLSTNGCIFLMIFKSSIPFLKSFTNITCERIPTPYFAAIAIFKIKYKT